MEIVLAIIAIFYGWIFVVGAARKGLTTLAHYAVHRAFAKKQSTNRFIGEVLTTIFFVINFKQYEKDHVRLHHNSKTFTTKLDPDAAFMLELGFTPDKTPQQLWRNLYRNLYSPSFHGRFIKARFKQNFVTAPTYRIAMSVVWWTFIAAMATSGYALEILVAYLLPLSAPYHVSALLQFVSEHEWLGDRGEIKPAFRAHSLFSWGRFIGPSLPSEDLNLMSKAIAWVRLVLETLFIHIPIRVAVLPGDLQQHDHHHRKPMKGDWPNAAYDRMESVIEDDSEVKYRHFWSLREAIDHVFNRLGRKR